MAHLAVEKVLERAERAKNDSDFTYFFSLLLAGEALAKTIVLGIVASIDDDKDRNRYRLEHQLVRSNGLGDWVKSLEDALTGHASQFLLAREDQAALTLACKSGTWQFDATAELKSALDYLDITAEDLPLKSDLKRWFRLFATLRNKTRGHGATQTAKAAIAANHISDSIRLIYHNFQLLNRPWAYLYRNLSGKYRVSPITDNRGSFSQIKQSQEHGIPNGVYLEVGKPRFVRLLESDPELQDYFYANGGLTSKKYELLSYYSDDKRDGDAAEFQRSPGTLPPSETEGPNELDVRGKCLTNLPELQNDYINRPELESQLEQLLLDDKRPIVTLVGRGGIGKTSLALKVINGLCSKDRYSVIVWLSARDVDLQLTGPKPVRPTVLTQDDMSRLYASLVLSSEQQSDKAFNAKVFFEEQLQKCQTGLCLFVFDNFETTQNPVEVFNWIDAFVRLPNKVLITTRLRDFKGDYPVEVEGMNEPEARQLITQTASSLNVTTYVNETYVADLLRHSEGHPYVIKVLLGEVAKLKRAANIPNLVAGTEDILTALFERTYAALSPCAQRAFLTLSGWNSTVPRLALEAVLYRSTQERSEVEKGIESLVLYSMAESHVAQSDKQEFLSLPLVTSVFGKKKLNIHPAKPSIQSDIQMLQMLGPSRREDMKLGLSSKISRFVRTIARRIEEGARYEEFAPVIEAICRAYNPGWLLLGRWHVEQRTAEAYEHAKEELRRFLENAPPSDEAAEAWRLLAIACFKTHDTLGEVHAFVERAHSCQVPFNDLSSTANKVNQLKINSDIDKDHKRDLAGRILNLLDSRRDEAEADDFARMAWLALTLGKEDDARAYVGRGLKLDSENHHLCNLEQKLTMS